MIKNIFFDFDGVIADSVDVKTEAFEKMYLAHGAEIAAKVVKHHNENGGMSRFEKFKHYHKNYLGIELNEDGVQQLARQFSDLVLQGVVEAKEVAGSHAFLKANKNKLKMFIITGTPTEESIEICKSRGIIDCFQEICGSPQKKDYWSKYLLNKYKLDKDETIFVGDALADYNAAKANNLAFFLRQNNQNKDLFENIHDVIRFDNFNDFSKKADLV